jgi:hypothetical protein
LTRVLSKWRDTLLQIWTVDELYGSRSDLEAKEAMNTMLSRTGNQGLQSNLSDRLISAPFVSNPRTLLLRVLATSDRKPPLRA